MHLLWINQVAAFQGGCERYIFQTVARLRARGVQSTLLYDPNHPTEVAYLKGFDAAFPLVDAAAQVGWIKPDLLYVHRITGRRLTQQLTSLPVPAARFFHDHQLFCLRDYKYTAIGHQPCSRTTGPWCYLPCVGFVGKSVSWPGIRFSRLGTLQAEQRANRAFDAIVVGSEYMAGHAAAHGLDRAKIRVIPLFVEPPDQSAGTPEREENLILFVGQLLRGKGLDILIDAVALVRRPVRLVIAGAGHQEALFRERARQRGVENRIDFVGRLDDSALEDYYHRAACVVVPSRTPETLGLVGIEALARGTPVVSSLIGGTGEWLKPGVTGLAAEAADSGSFALAIDRMLEDRQASARMSEAGRRLVLEKFTPERHINGLMELFESLRGKARAA